MNDKGQSSVHGSNGDSGNSFANGSGPNWQRYLYGWVRDLNCWDFMEPGCTS